MSGANWAVRGAVRGGRGWCEPAVLDAGLGGGCNGARESGDGRFRWAPSTKLVECGAQFEHSDIRLHWGFTTHSERPSGSSLTEVYRSETTLHAANHTVRTNKNAFAKPNHPLMISVG